MKNEIVIPTIENSSIFLYIPLAKQVKESVCDWHFHDELEVYFLADGEKIFYVGDKIIELKSGDMIFVNKRIPHKTRSFEGSSGMLIQFKNDFSENKEIPLPSLDESEDFAFFEGGSKINLEILKIFEKIKSEYLKKDDFFDMYIKSYVCELSACLYRNGVIQKKEDAPKKSEIAKILPAINFINNHYFEQISLEDVSRILNVDKSHFCRLFKGITGMSFVDYLNYVRIQKAEKLLSETLKSVSEIAFETGFLSSSYFSEIFKRNNFITPREYRKMITANKKEL